jgi:histidine ammonia-lyase
MRRNDSTTRQSSVTRFNLGQTFITPGAEEAIQIAGQTEIEFLRRHMSCDWGDLSEDDIRENELSLKEGLRLLSAYQTGKGQKLWIITEADRSATTILLPSEY